MVCAKFYGFDYLQNFTRSRRGGRVVCEILRARRFMGGGVAGVRGWACSLLHVARGASLFRGDKGDKRGFSIKSFIHVIRVYEKMQIIALIALCKILRVRAGGLGWLENS